MRHLLVLAERVPERDDVGVGKSLILVQRGGLNVVVVDAELFVRVTGGEVEEEVVAESIVGVVELGELGVGGVELEGARLDDEPEDENGEANDDNDGDEQLPEEVEEAATAASGPKRLVCHG
ncbi:hypothetical protein QN277_013174 [Acacia crassicarpa]|uniref:Uncharacterized protein n=1 Tax=Acacia crassicarpa TaxID=499986 RepID=A0AAE1N245_9FABA|nr:hypothetical protein QN277_013174 [Acacia crassicarpa]